MGAAHRGWAPAALSVALVWAAPLAAQDDVSRLRLVAPERCPTTATLEEEIASLVGRPSSEITLPPSLDPVVTITAEGTRYALVVHDGDETRTLRDASCTALVRAAALIVALSVDADAATLRAASAADADPAPAPAAEVPPAPTVPAAPVVPAAPRAARTPRRRYVFEWADRLSRPYHIHLPTFAIGAGAIGEIGVVPVASAALVVNVLLRIDRFEARVRGGYVLEQSENATSGVSASAALGTALLCGRPFENDFPLAFCLGGEAGPVFARSFGRAIAGSVESWTASAVVGLWLPLIPWPHVDVSLGAEAWVRLLRPELELSGVGRVWEGDPFGGRFALLAHFSP